MQDVNDRRNCVCVRGVYGNSVLSAQFFCKPKTSEK